MFKVHKNTTTVKAKPQGVILYRGPSLIDGSAIVCVATGLTRRGKNPKTGSSAVQTYVLADNTYDPIQARRNGGDRSICGDCPHKGSTCYVDVSKAPLAIWRAVQRGSYPDFDPAKHLDLFKGRYVRLGSYGDPAAVPLSETIRKEGCINQAHFCCDLG